LSTNMRRGLFRLKIDMYKSIFLFKFLLTVDSTISS
jgi:hypothetical protein